MTEDNKLNNSPTFKYEIDEQASFWLHGEYIIGTIVDRFERSGVIIYTMYFSNNPRILETADGDKMLSHAIREDDIIYGYNELAGIVDSMVGL